MSARKEKNLKQVKYQLKSLEEAFERDATARHKNISVRSALIIAQECVDKQIGAKPYKKKTYEGVSYICSSCGAWLNGELAFVPKYCIICGQKLDWSDVD